MGIVCTEYKEGALSKCDSYRGIMLLSFVYKVLSSISNKICRKNNLWSSKWIQNGRGTISNVQIFRQIIEKVCECNVQIQILCIDFKQPFLSIQRHQKIKISQLQGFPVNL
jgi:hypothetical protein